MRTTRIKRILELKPEEQQLTVKGWVRTKRESKAFAFLEINDGSCLGNLQVIIDETVSGYRDWIGKANTGASVEITGKLAASPGKGQKSELHASNVILHGEADPETYPLQKKRHSFEFLREIAHLRPRTNTLGAVTRVRSSLSFAIHKFFQERDFVYIHTPIITASDCEGAGEMFQVTTLPLQKPPVKEGNIDYTQDFFGQKTSLTVSGQLEGEIYACALGNIYTFGPTFRAEHSNTSRHLAEFWMVEPEMAFCDIEGDMDIAEDFLKYIFSYILENCRGDMQFFDKWIEKGVIEKLKTVINNNFARITYTEAIEHLEKAKVEFQYPVKWGIDLQSEHEKYITEQVYKKPVIVTGYPREIKAFYMKLNEDEKTVRAMDVLVPRLGEIIGGSERENDYDKLAARIKAMGLAPEDYWWYLDLRRYGSVPHAGFGLGFERAIQFITGMQNIRDVIPFPRAWGSIGF